MKQEQGTAGLAIFVALLVIGGGVGVYYIFKTDREPGAPATEDVQAPPTAPVPRPAEPVALPAAGPDVQAPAPAAVAEPHDTPRVATDRRETRLTANPLLQRMEAAPNQRTRLKILDDLLRKAGENPRDAQSWIDAALGYSLSDQPDRAAASFRRALAIDPQLRGRPAIERLLKEYDIKAGEARRGYQPKPKNTDKHR